MLAKPLNVTFERSMGERMQIARKKLGLNQIDLAKSLGYGSGGPISKMENGDQDIPTCVLALMNRQYGVDLNWLIAGQAATNCPACSYRAGIKALVKALYDAEAGSDCQASH